MGLSASMWTSVSGLLAHGNKMNVVGNNIANVSTIGFKGQRMDFNDYLYINGGSTSGPTQIGAGVSTYAVIGDFSQGSLESTNSVTDLAIDGNGFFKVRKPNSDDMYYTRAGDFYFNADRQLQNPEGYRLQGWKIDNSTRLTFKSDSVNLGENTANETAFQGTGTPQDIILDSWYLEPQRTSSVNFTMGLTSDGNGDRSTSTENPMTALFDQWDATKKPPMPDTSYATSSSIKVYDEGGTPHTMTVYYDQVATKSNSYEIAGLPAGYTMYEYVVTIPPEEDMRTYGGQGYDPESNEWLGKEPTSFYNPDPEVCNKNAGMLMTGHLIFDASGNLVNQTAYTYGGSTADMGDNNQYNGNPADLKSWQSTKFSSNGLPVFTANFTGQPLANTVNETTTNGKSQAQDYIIELDLGLRNLGGKTGDWEPAASSLFDLQGESVTKQEEVYQNAPFTGTAYIEGSDTYWYKDPEVENAPWQAVTVTTKADGTQELTVGNPPEVINGPIYTQKMQTGGTVRTDTIFGKDFKINNDPANPTASADEKGKKYYVTDITSTPNKRYQIIDKQGDEITLLEVDANGNAPDPTATKKATISNFTTTSTPPGGAGANTDQYAGNIEVMSPNYSTATPTPKYADDVAQNAYYRDENGEYKPAWDAGAGALAEAAKGKPLFLQTIETATHTTIDFSAVPRFANAERMENATTAGNKSFITQDAGQNGYASGILSSTNITDDGVVYGYYDNGQTIPLYQIALYDFHNHQGLRREGGNLYAQTKESGEARQGVAGEAGFGVTRAYNIEMSNVDLSREFVNMITTQRGFQANSKGVTTVDTMLETVIGMKR